MSGPRERFEDMSQRELDDYLDRLSDSGQTDTREFRLAYAEWERRDA